MHTLVLFHEEKFFTHPYALLRTPCVDMLFPPSQAQLSRVQKLYFYTSQTQHAFIMVLSIC